MTAPLSPAPLSPTPTLPSRRAQDIFSVAGKCALVTGAAQGLGRAMAEVLAANGANLVLFDSDSALLAETASALRGGGGDVGGGGSGAQVLAIAGDVTDAAAVQAMVRAGVAAFGALDIAIANAGISDAAPAVLHHSDPADWARVIDVNLNGLYYTCRAALEVMAAQGFGKVITLASMWGHAAPAGAFPRPAYAASKGAVVNLTREMALQYAAAGIQINALCPGIFQTETRPRDPVAGAAYTPMGRLGQPAELDGAVLFLASSASDFMTGASLVIDGGVLAR